MFEEIHGAPQLSLADVRRFASGVLVLIYTPGMTIAAHPHDDRGGAAQRDRRWS